MPTRRATYAGGVPQSEQVRITDVHLSTSEDLERRQRRYLKTMAVRVVCFGLMLVVPGWWKLVALLGAVFLPAAAVLLANNTDRRVGMAPLADDQPSRPELLAGDVIRGEVADDESTSRQPTDS